MNVIRMREYIMELGRLWKHINPHELSSILLFWIQHALYNHIFSALTILCR